MEQEPRDLLDAAMATGTPQLKETVEMEEGVDMTQLHAVEAVEKVDRRFLDDEESVASDGTLDLEAEELAAEELENEPVETPVEKEIEEATVVVATMVVETLKSQEETEPTTARETGAVDAADESAPIKPADVSSSSSSSSSSDSSSSDSSDSSSDSEVEDVTDQYKATAPASVELMRTQSESEDDNAEQWFQEHDLEVDGMEVVAVVRTESQEDEDVFLLPEDPPVKPSTSAFSHVERGSATKRRRPEDDSEVVRAGEETASSSDAEQSDNEFGRRNASKPRRTQEPKKSRGPGRPSASSSASVVKYTSVPPAYSIFENIAADDSEFPILKGTYTIQGGHRAHFSGQWGFTDSDFAQSNTSKFEYSSGYIHGRDEDDSRPFSGKYGGFFNLRQFNGKIVKIKEDSIEFHFIRLVGEEQEEEGDETKYEVLGDGKNRYGRFLVRGYFNAADGRIRVRRRYLE